MKQEYVKPYVAICMTICKDICTLSATSMDGVTWDAANGGHYFEDFFD